MYRDLHRRVYDAESDGRGRVVVTLHSSVTPTNQELAAARHAFSIGRRLAAVEGVVGHLELVDTGGDLALVTERIPDARPLRSLVGNVSNVVEVCEIGAALADAIGNVHREGFVHGGLAPENILVAADGAAWLLGFGAATDITTERAGQFELARLGPSLAYVSPEQTGRVNRPVDTRSDLYSLGIILFELLTGSTPFRDRSPRALVHAHIARVAPRVDDQRSGTPTVLCDLVDKLLAKDPESRYKTAFAVAADLRSLAKAIGRGDTPAFELGRSDADPHLHLSDRLFGRDAEVDWLLQAYEAASGGRRSLVFIDGYSGIGKSRLVNELQHPIASADGWFATGKFDLYRRDLPYSAFIQASSELMRQVLTLPAGDLDAIRSALDVELRGSAGAIAELVPELTVLIGEPEAPGEVSPGDAQRRLEAGIVTLVEVLARAEHPLVLFIDDLQWCDLASLRLLDALLDDNGERSALVLVLAWRNNEVGPGHAAWSFIERHADHATSITLEPLGFDALTEWIATSLRTSAPEVKDLVQLTLDKTAGNPFFVRRFMRDLADKQLIGVDSSGSWTWDTAAIERHSVYENVGELVAQQVQRLDPSVRRVLQVASCIGPQFDRESVMAVVDNQIDDVTDRLHEGLRAGLIVPCDDDYRYASDDSDGINPTYAFLHDRVQETAHETMEADARADAHLAIAHHRTSQAMASSEGPESFAVDIASHYVAGRTAVGDAERLEAARWLVTAAVRAKSVMATETAQEFLDLADTFLPSDRWVTAGELARSMHTEAADVAYIEGRFTDIDRHADAVLLHTSDPLRRLPIHNIRIGIGVAQSRWAEATEYALDVLADEYDLHLPLRPSLGLVAAEIGKLRWLLRGHTPEELRDLPTMDDDHVDASMSLLMKTATNAYWASPNLVPLIGMTMVRQSLRHGNSALSAYGYVLYGLVQSAVLFNSETGYRYGELAMATLERFGARHLYGKTALINDTFIRPGVDPMAACGRDVLHAFHEARAAGDIENAAYCAMASYYTAVVSGESLGSLAMRLEPYVAAVRTSGHAQTIYGTSVWVQAVANLRSDQPTAELRGEFIDFEPVLADLLEEEDGNAIPQGVCAAGFLAFLLGDDERAERHLGLLFRNARNTPGQAYLMPCLAMYAILLTRREAAGGVSNRARVLAITKLLQRRAKSNAGDHRPFLEFIAAERDAASGRSGAESKFLDAAVLAADNGITYLEALALERAAELHSAGGHGETARGILARAVAAWRRYGATGRLVRLGVDPHEDSARTDPSIDVDTLLETAVAVSSEIEVDGVVTRVLQLALENAGARRAILALRQGTDFVAHASAEASDGGGIAVTMLRTPVGDLAPAWPIGVLDYVRRTGNDLVVPDASTDIRFERDSYVRAHKVRSVLCAPLHRGGELVGVLYLENSLGHDIFTSDHVAVTRAIVGQAAIAIENAGLYEQQREMATAFGRFVPRPFLELLGRDTVTLVELGDAVASDVTILFSDLRGFTSLAETMTAAENFELLNAYLERMNLAIHRHGGFIDKFIGDAVMALFTGSADEAVTAAVEMTAALADFNAERLDRDPTAPILQMGVGIHAGPVVLGTVGSAERMDTTVIGDTVNSASRLEGLTKHYNAAVLVSDAVLDRLRDPGRLTVREVGRVRVKGKQQPITVHEVLDARGGELENFAASRPAFLAGMQEWYRGNFADAATHFGEATRITPGDVLAAHYVERALELQAGEPPDDWDGVDVRAEK